uniref:Uncharacterized protein n=1 Tax=Cacopsylla melanoneura TaxID=428564 RepID=A0A8D9E725_9HEMI
MACLFLIMLLFLNTVKAIECHENWPRSVEIKKEKCFMEETHQRNGENAVDDREDSLHRIRREDSIQNLFHKTPWHSLEQDGNNVKQKHLIFRDKGGERWKSFIQNKIRKKRANNMLWPEWRKREHSQFMKKYWKEQIEDNTTRFINQKKLMGDIWVKQKEEGNKTAIGRQMSENLKNTWKWIKSIGCTERQEKIRRTMLKLWNDQGAKKRRAHGEKIRKYWARTDEHGNPDKKIVKHRQKFMDCWIKRQEEGNTELNVKMSVIKKQFWHNISKEGRRKHGDKVRKFWARMRGPEGNQTFVQKFKKNMRKIKKNLWKKKKEERKREEEFMKKVMERRKNQTHRVLS